MYVMFVGVCMCVCVCVWSVYLCASMYLRANNGGQAMRLLLPYAAEEAFYDPCECDKWHMMMVRAVRACVRARMYVC